MNRMSDVFETIEKTHATKLVAYEVEINEKGEEIDEQEIKAMVIPLLGHVNSHLDMNSNSIAKNLSGIFEQAAHRPPESQEGLVIDSQSVSIGPGHGLIIAHFSDRDGVRIAMQRIVDAFTLITNRGDSNA